MKTLTVVALAILAAGAAAVAQQSPLTLWYTKPAESVDRALPVGNGRMGAMVFGGAAHERIQFNEQHRLDRRAPRLRPQGRRPIAGQRSANCSGPASRRRPRTSP